MPRIVTSRKRQRPATPPASASDRIVRAAAIAVVAICAVFAAWRLLSPPEAAKPGATPVQAGQKGQGRGVPAATPETPEAARPDAASPSTDGRSVSGQKNQGRGAPASTEIENPPEEPPPASAPPPAPPSATPREREFFDNEIENTIASVSEPGAEFFGFPPGTEWEEDEILEVLRRPVVIEEDDDDAAIAAKERTAEFKAKALKAIEEDGLTFNQFIRDIVALRNEQAAMREDAYQQMVKILRRDGEPAARDYLNSINPELKAQGMKEIAISPLLLEDARKRRQRGGN